MLRIVPVQAFRYSQLRRPLFIYARWRTFCTRATTAIPVEILQRSGLMNIVLPLPNAEKCSFPLYPTRSVYELICDIREEDRPYSEIVLTDKQGNRILHETPISQLLNQPFVISIDDQNYSVEPLHMSNVSENLLSTQDLRDITLHAYHQKIRTLLMEQKRHYMPYSEYLIWCESYGLTHEQAATLSKALHKAGIILHFHENDDLKGVIFLKPEVITDALAVALDLKYHTRDAPALRQQLETLLPQYLPLNELKKQYDVRAERNAKWWMKGALVYLTIQFGILARMVWIDFNWDIMEPITYFVGVFTLMGGYIFFVLYGEDYTYKALENRQRLLALKKLYISKEFNWQKWNTLHQQVEGLKKLLGGVNLEEMLKQPPNSRM